jgi:NTP pyrophosphatase (non-canonical NTP hydrolase)
MLELVRSWRKIMGLPSLKSTVSIPSEDKKDLCAKLLNEEVAETLSAIQKNDLKEVVDGVGDVFFVLVQVCEEYGIDLGDAVKAVYISNMTKFCITEAEAESTIEAYFDGTHHSKPGEKIITYRKEQTTTEGKTIWVIHRASDGKVLKSLSYKEPDFSKILN